MKRFWSKVKKTPGCWYWQGTTATNNGYGRFRFEGRMRVAHRVAWILTHGPIPEGKRVLHHCDTPSCVNPDCLFLGTQADNMRDRDKKGRLARGVKVGNSKLNPSLVQAMRREAEAGDSIRTIAARHGVHHSTVSRAIRSKTWGHV